MHRSYDKLKDKIVQEVVDKALSQCQVNGAVPATTTPQVKEMIFQTLSENIMNFTK